MRPSEYKTTIDRHIAVFENGDKKINDDLLRMYQGKFWTEETGASESDLLKTSVNLTFAITETALSTLVPPNPQVTALARSPMVEDRIKATEAFANFCLDASNYRDEQTLYTFDAVTYGRGVTKTSWSTKTDLPVVRSVDTRGFFFDLSARRESDMRYMIETTLVGEDEFRARGYDAAKAAEVEPDTYPKWMLRNLNSSVNRNDLKNFQRWVTVYEIYDLERGKVVHMAANSDTILMEDDLLYNPYDIATLNYNGEDCRGQSEIALISPNQEELNHLLTYWLNIVKHSVPKGMFDPSNLDAEQLAKAIAAPLGSWSPVAGRNNVPIAQSLGAFPMPQVPTDALALIDKVWSNIEVVSALAAAQRGQVTGARTATELALIEGQLRNRLSSRTRKLDRITESVAGKMLFLAQRFMSEEKLVQITGREGWHPVHPDTLVGVNAAFKMQPYSPIETNRMVVQEQLTELFKILANNPAIDQRKLARVMIDSFDNPYLRNRDVFLPEQPPAPPPAPPGVDPSAAPAPPAPGIDPRAPATEVPGMAQNIIDRQVPLPGQEDMAAPGGEPKIPGLPVPG